MIIQQLLSSFYIFSPRNWIVSMRSPRMAAQQSSQGQPQTFDRPMNFQRLDSVVAARRVMPTHPVSASHKPQPRRYAELIEADKKDEELGHDEQVKDG
jgi:hypothetical protein